jgi:hypothetical protein
VWLAVRLLGALALVAVGVVQLYVLERHGSQVATTNAVYLLTFLVAVGVGLCLLAPVEQIAGRSGCRGVVLAGVAGIALAAVAFAYEPPGTVAGHLADGAAVLLLGAFLAGRVGKATMRRW